MDSLAQLGLTRRFVWIVLLISLSYIFVHDVWWKQPEIGNEGVNAIMALNMVESFDKVIRPSYVPLGYPDWLQADLPTIGNTPFHSALLALGQWVFGLRGMAMTSFIALLATLYFTYHLVFLWQPMAAWIVVLMMALAPPFLWFFQLIQFEPLLTAFGMSGLYVFVLGTRTHDIWKSAIGGALIGLGFLTKLWLIVPAVFAALGYLLCIHCFWRGSIAFRTLFSAFLGFIAASSLHLLFVALYMPSDVKFWLTDVYFAVFLQKGISGSKWQGLSAYPNWSHSFWYYPVIIFRDYYVLAISIFLGFPSLYRNFDRQQQPLLWLLSGGLLSIVLLSVPAIKESLYILPAMPFVFMFAGICVAALITDPQMSKVRFWFSVVVLVGLLVGLWVLYVKGVRRDTIHLSYMIPYTATVMLSLALLWAIVNRRSLHYLAMGSVVLALAAFIGFSSQRQRPFGDIERSIRPAVAHSQSLSEPSFVSPNVHVLEYYLFQKGDYWGEDPLSQIVNKKYLAFVVGPNEQKDPKFALTLDRLSRDFHELETNQPGYRVFVRIPRPV